MLFKIKSYVRFFWNSSNQHGVHSPFIYNLVAKCFYDKKRYEEYSIIEKFRNKNKISADAKISLLRLKLLFRIVKYFQPTIVVVVDSLSHREKLSLSLGNPKAKFISLKEVKPLLAVNLIYFETNRFLNETIDQFELLLTTVSNNTVWIFNEIYANEETKKMWQTIKDHPKVQVTVDTFAFGIVFFRAEQQKEHFVIRV